MNVFFFRMTGNHPPAAAALRDCRGVKNTMNKKRSLHREWHIIQKLHYDI